MFTAFWNIRKSIRFRMSLMLAMAMFVMGLMRIDLNMAMICMINRTDTTTDATHLSNQTLILDIKRELNCHRQPIATIVTNDTDMRTNVEEVEQHS